MRDSEDAQAPRINETIDTMPATVFLGINVKADKRSIGKVEHVFGI